MPAVNHSKRARPTAAAGGGPEGGAGAPDALGLGRHGGLVVDGEPRRARALAEEHGARVAAVADQQRAPEHYAQDRSRTALPGPKNGHTSR